MATESLRGTSSDKRGAAYFTFWPLERFVVLHNLNTLGYKATFNPMVVSVDECTNLSKRFVFNFIQNSDAFRGSLFHVPSRLLES